MNKKLPEFYTVPQIAKLLGVHSNTIYRAIQCGRIQAFRVGSGKRASFRIFKTEIKRMAAFDAKEMIDRIVERNKQG